MRMRLDAAELRGIEFTYLEYLHDLSSAPKTDHVVRAQLVHLNISACFRSAQRFAGFLRVNATASAMLRAFKGSQYSVTSPPISGKDAALERTTGHPSAMASNGGSPKPS